MGLIDQGRRVMAAIVLHHRTATTARAAPTRCRPLRTAASSRFPRSAAADRRLAGSPHCKQPTMVGRIHDHDEVKWSQGSPRAHCTDGLSSTLCHNHTSHCKQPDPGQVAKRAAIGTPTEASAPPGLEGTHRAPVELVALRQVGERAPGVHPPWVKTSPPLKVKNHLL